jgi:hypothetical protein
MNVGGGGFPENITDVVLSDDDDEPTCLPGQNALADRDASVVDGDVCARTTSNEATIPGLTATGVPGIVRPLTTNWASIVPASWVLTVGKACTLP